MSDSQPSVLVVEDEPDLADLYSTWLESDYQVRTAYGGQEALDKLDDEVDVVLLDRRMPDLPGDEVLATVREHGFECRVAMVTAVEPDFDIIAMGFDDYLVKPVSKDTLKQTVSNLLVRDDYTEGVQELFSIASKKALLESEKSSTELADNGEYQELEERLNALRSDLDDKLASLSNDSDLAVLYHDIGRDADETGDQ